MGRGRGRRVRCGGEGQNGVSWSREGCGWVRCVPVHDAGLVGDDEAILAMSRLHYDRSAPQS